MATQYGTILTIWGHTTPFYDIFTLDEMSSNQRWNYDDGAVTAGNFIPGVEYTIASVGTTDFTLWGSANNTVGTTFTARNNPDGTSPTVTLYNPGLYASQFTTGVGTGTGTATVAGYTKLAQPLPAAGQVSFNYVSSTAPIGGQPQTQGSPNVSTSFVVEIAYLAGAGPDYTQTFDYYRDLAIAAINSAFGLALA